MYLFRTATTDEQGRYEFSAVPPGKYKIFAWENPEPGIWFAPGFLKSYESQGQAITLEPKESRAIEVRVSVRPDA
jgi:protocatechuate 3,4-dioxygenase beta subunit